jgi:two-component system sensor histidine kinase RpfC
MKFSTNQRILVATSNSIQRRILRGVLEKAGYRVVTASSSDEALDELESKVATFQMVIADTALPGLGGLDVIRVLRYLDSAQRVRAIVRAEQLCEEVRVAAVAAGADELLPIPVEEDLLLAVVRRLMPPETVPAVSSAMA